MRLHYSSLIKVLLLLVVVSLASGAAAWAAPSVTTDPVELCKTLPNVDYGGCCNQQQNPKVATTTDRRDGCCYQGQNKLAATTDYQGGCCYQGPTKLAATTDYKGGCCVQYGKLAVATTEGQDYGGCCSQPPAKLAVNVVGQGNNQCCDQQTPFKLAVNTTSHDWQPQNCPPPPAPQTASCDIDASGVVGKLYADQIAFYAPGQITVPNIIVNAGTYIVGGIATDDSGNQFYRIVIGCQYLYVPIDTMGPNPDPPQNGEALPTNAVS